jgi:hypothetical protein
MLLSYLSILPMIKVERLFKMILRREWWDKRQFKGYSGNSISFFYDFNLRGCVIRRVCWLTSWRPNPNITSLATLCLYFSQYGELSPLIFLFPSKAYQHFSTLASHFSYFSAWSSITFRVHQHLWLSESVYLFLKGTNENVGDLSVVSVKIEIA